MSEQQIFALTVLLVLLLCSGVLFYYMRLRHIERMELIKRGGLIYEPNYLTNLKYSVLSKAILFISLGIGLGVAYFITLKITNDSEVIIYLICLSLFAGIGLGVYYLFLKKKVE